MPSGMCNSIMTIATGLISSLFNITSSQGVPFCQLWQLQSLHHGSMVQLSSKVSMHSSQTCSGHVLLAFWMHPMSGKKGHGSYIKSCCSFIERFCTCTDVAHVHSGHISRAFWTWLTCVTDVCERYLGAELYRTKAYLCSPLCSIVWFLMSKFGQNHVTAD